MAKHKSNKTKSLIWTIVSLLVMSFVFGLIFNFIIGDNPDTLGHVIEIGMVIGELGNILGLLVISLSFVIEPFVEMLGGIRNIRKGNKYHRKKLKQKHKDELEIMLAEHNITKVKLQNKFNEVKNSIKEEIKEELE